MSQAGHETGVITQQIPPGMTLGQNGAGANDVCACTAHQPECSRHAGTGCDNIVDNKDASALKQLYRTSIEQDAAALRS